MAAFKGLILTICAVSVIEKLISIICSDKYKDQMKLISSMVIILCISSQLDGGITLPDTSYYEYELEKAQANAIEAFLSETEEQLSQQVCSILKANNITPQKVCIACSYDEYKYISISEIELYINDESISDDMLEEILAPYFHGTRISIKR